MRDSRVLVGKICPANCFILCPKLINALGTVQICLIWCIKWPPKLNVKGYVCNAITIWKLRAWDSSRWLAQNGFSYIPIRSDYLSDLMAVSGLCCELQDCRHNLATRQKLWLRIARKMKNTPGNRGDWRLSRKTRMDFWQGGMMKQKMIEVKTPQMQPQISNLSHQNWDFTCKPLLCFASPKVGACVKLGSKSGWWPWWIQPLWNYSGER